MRITLDLDAHLLAQAMAISGIRDKSRLLQEALRSLIGREAGRRLGKLGGTAPTASAGRRRRTAMTVSSRRGGVR
jgi:Arc/MetJ family transcription regulator